MLYPIKVPDSRYCWEKFPPYTICNHCDNSSGLNECTLGLSYELEETNKGILKPKKCLKLSNQRKIKGEE